MRKYFYLGESLSITLKTPVPTSGERVKISDYTLSATIQGVNPIIRVINDYEVQLFLDSNTTLTKLCEGRVDVVLKLASSDDVKIGKNIDLFAIDPANGRVVDDMPDPAEMSLAINTGELVFDMSLEHISRDNYKIWLDNGHTGTEVDYLDWLRKPATDAAAAANDAAGSANNASTEANQAAAVAEQAAEEATQAANLAGSKATWANNAAVAANQAAEYAGEAGDDANAAAALAVQKAGSANDAATAANTAANLANQKAVLADEKALLAGQKATEANTAAGSANDAATTANKTNEDIQEAEGLRVAAETARNVASNMYNVTLAIPLTAGQYYTSITARAAVPEGVRKRGLLITYETSAGIWNTEKFKGAATSTWSNAADWEIIYSQKNMEDVELTSAEALNVLYNRIVALENFIATMVINVMQADTINVVKSFNLFGDSNMVLVRAVAPAVIPNFIGQRYINTVARTKYTAVGTGSVADWIQD